ISGKEIMQMRIASSETSIDMQSLPSSTYFVRVTKGKNEVKTFKVVKN
ncbi:MAG: T9SS type A sorting domain-containing protein, partial [Bacteroidales bacterium]|nr:T9SS type A sorting domain-containing protein [Bacteroidales bacterium]